MESSSNLLTSEASTRPKQYKRYRRVVRRNGNGSIIIVPRSTEYYRRKRMTRNLLPAHTLNDIGDAFMVERESDNEPIPDSAARIIEPQLDHDVDEQTINETIPPTNEPSVHQTTQNNTTEFSNFLERTARREESDLSDAESMADESDDFDANNRPIFGKAKCTKGELTSLVMALVLRHSLTKSCLINIIAILQYMVPGCILKSKYFFDKMFFKSDKIVFKHFYCPRCSTYLGKQKKSWFCKSCKRRVRVQECIKKKKYMLVSPLEGQLRELFENTNLYTQIEKGKERALSNASYFSEISSGHHYKTEKMRLFMQEKGNFSMTFSTDGVQIHKSSKFAVWPIYLTVNEVGLHNKQKHIILHSLYFGHNKPNPDTLLRPLVQEMRRLSLVGFKWKDKSTGNVIRSKVAFPVCIADAPARAMIQNFKQFNGEFGCNYCLHKGVVIKKGKGHARVYPMTNPLPEKRTHESSFSNAVVATNQDKAYLGVKGPSYLHLIPHFDIVKGIIPDSMHGIYLGVVKQFMELWTAKSSSKRDYYISPEALDNELLKIKPPSQIARLPRSYSIFGKQWKASEYRNFLLFYSAPILKNLLKEEYYYHWLLLVNGTLKLVEKKISEKELATAHLLFMKFIFITRKLYTKKQVTYNVHLLQHVAESVKEFGALWNNSAFIYEDAGGLMKHQYHGSKEVALQIFTNVIARKRLRDFARKYIPGSSERVIKLYQRLDKSMLTFHNQVKPSGIGKPEQLQFTRSEIIDLQLQLGRDIKCTTAFSYQRMNFARKIYSTASYSNKFKRDDSLIETKDSIILKIEKFIEISFSCSCALHVDTLCDFSQGTGELVIFGEQIKTTAFPTSFDDYTKEDLTGFLRLLTGVEGNMIFYPQRIGNKCVQVPYSDNDIAIAPVTTIFELD